MLSQSRKLRQDLTLGSTVFPLIKAMNCSKYQLSCNPHQNVPLENKMFVLSIKLCLIIVSALSFCYIYTTYLGLVNVA